VSGREAVVAAPDDTAQEVAEAFAEANPAGSRTRTIVWQDFDVLADAAGMPPYEELKAESVEREVFGHMVRVASIDHLIAMKKAAGRTKDKLMVEEYIVIAERQRAAGERG
jgi:hypothetical protein